MDNNPDTVQGTSRPLVTNNKPIEPSPFTARKNVMESHAKPLLPMTPIEAAGAVINLLLATGPFSYPQGFSQLGPVFSMILLVITTFIAYITSTFMVEAISVAHAEDDERRRDSMFGETCYKSPIIKMQRNKKDMSSKQSPFYIRKKIEIGIVAQTIA